MKLQRSISEKIRMNLSWEQKWRETDKGLVACWERGREKLLEDTALASRARDGELVTLPWKGGVERKLKKEKFGSLNYLAMWQGLRGDDLDIDIELEISLTCTKHKMKMTFTPDSSKYADE
jgi:hypothetical protein